MQRLLPVLCLLATAAVLVAASSGAPRRAAVEQEGREPSTPPAPKPAPLRTFTGSSLEGDVQQALDAALRLAQRTLGEHTADLQFRWELDALSGTRGGYAGSTLCEVRIRVLP